MVTSNFVILKTDGADCLFAMNADNEFRSAWVSDSGGTYSAGSTGGDVVATLERKGLKEDTNQEFHKNGDKPFEYNLSGMNSDVLYDDYLVKFINEWPNGHFIVEQPDWQDKAFIYRAIIAPKIYVSWSEF